LFSASDVEVREREFCIVRAGEVLPVEPKAFRVLLFLLRNPHKLIKKTNFWTLSGTIVPSLKTYSRVALRLYGVCFGMTLASRATS
jgi:hypothetical protein